MSILRTLALIIVLGVAALVVAFPLHAEQMRTHTAPGLGDYNVPFWPEGTYRPGVKSPSEFLGWQLGSRAIRHEEVVRYFSYLSDNFSNAYLVEYAKSYEGRGLYYLVVTSVKNARNLAEIRRDNDKLADPRKLGSGDEATRIIENLPAVAWMAYAIHGDELSSTDAAVQLAYQLVAGEDAISEKIRDEVVVCIDPMENPDGRMRWIQQINQWNGVVPNTDIQSMQHVGMWPWGRTNHYFFDLNRDWFTQVHPESRGRSEAILKWHPHFVVDAHEMGALSTYLFSPPRAPFNPHMVPQIYKWWDIAAKDQAAAFDRYGWSYYTREWNEEFFPGYGSSWAIYTGAIGMLYEQSRASGSQIKRPDGTVTTFRETVHHQFISSMANLATIAGRRQELVEDYYNEKQRALGTLSRRGERRSGGAAFVFAPTENKSRLEHFAETLRRQEIEIDVATQAFDLANALPGTGGGTAKVHVGKGALIVKLAQPMRPLVEAILTFDIRIPTDFLKIERKELLKKGQSKLYESTGWSLPLAYNLESYYTESLPAVATEPFTARRESGRLMGHSPRFGYAIDASDDACFPLLAKLFDRGYNVWCARMPFETDGRTFEAGALVLKLTGNPGIRDEDMKKLAAAYGIDIYAVNTALGGNGVDLGGGEVVLLHAPRIGLIGGPQLSSYGFGAVWHLLDSRMEYRTTTLNIVPLSGMDLRKYNVLVMPQESGAEVYKRMLGDDGIKRLKQWVRDGGTLVALGNAAAFCADSSVAISTVRKKEQVLKQIKQYDAARKWFESAEHPEVDSLDVWEAASADETKKKKAEKADIEALKTADELARRLRPRGTILAAELDPTAWLCFGVRSPVPVMVSTSHAYVAKKNVQIAARLADEKHLRLSGLLWPEARERWSQTAYATRESLGNGQVVLFAGEPNFRAYFRGGERMLLNAIFLGPGFGARPPLDW